MRVARGRDVDVLLDDWVRSLERGVRPGKLDVAADFVSERDDDSGLDPLEEPGLFAVPQRPARAAPPPPRRAPEVPQRSAAGDDSDPWRAVDVDGALVTFADEPREVALIRGPAGLQHFGTVAVRGPASPTTAVWAELSLADPQRHGLEFVAAWFGAPFDAVDTTDELSWGCWRFRGDALARCLATWKAEAPDSFERLLGGWGIDVEHPTVGGMTVTEPRRGALLSGERALRALAFDERLLATMARAGREPAAQRAQLRTVVERSALPALAVPVAGGDTTRPLGEVMRSPRACATVFFTELTLGLRGVAHLAKMAGDVKAEVEVVPAVRRFVELLERAGRSDEAHQVLRILTSPELGS